MGLAAAIFALVALLMARSRPAPNGSSSTGPGPPPKLPTVPSGWRRLSKPVTVELAGEASAVLNSSAPIGTMQPFVAGDGLTYGAWVTYHPKPHGWVRAVEIWEAT